MSAETGILAAVVQVGFPIAVAVYLLYERTQTFKEQNLKWETMTSLLIDVLKANTTAQTELRVTIQKLCEIVNNEKNKI